MNLVKWFSFLVLLPCLMGCGWSGGAEHPLGWRAEDYFADQQTVALCKAIARRDPAGVRQNLTAKSAADVGKEGMTPLLWAVTSDFPEAAELLLQNGADPGVFVRGDFGARKQGIKKGVTALHVAAGKEDIRFLQAFLSHDADPNLVDKTIDEETPIFEVVSRVKQPVKHIDLLLEHGADLEHRVWGLPLVARTALRAQRYDVARELLERGARYDRVFQNEADKRRLIHVLLKEQNLARVTPQTRPDFEQLLEWLEAHGESIEQAKADLATGEY